MKRYILSILFCSLLVGGLVAQNNRANAKKLFEAGRYVEAKKVLQVLLKRSPRSGEFNYWYAVSCNETGDTACDVMKHLKIAVSRNVTDALDYAGDVLSKKYKYADAIDSYEEFLDASDDARKNKLVEAKLAHVKDIFRMVKTTERVCVVDSFVVDKDKFLSAYKCGVDVGTVTTAAEYFSRPGLDGMVAETERGTDLYYSQRVVKDSLSLLKIFHSSGNGKEWSTPVQIGGFDTGGNDSYPFLSADGATFYFSSDGEGSIGGYDIFVTRYDSERGTFMRPANVGMPFNSEANDYMMVVNEISNLGWFATDRRMPQGKVCVYVFVPNTVRDVYDFESEEYDRMLCLSHLTSIAETQTDENVLRTARRNLTMLLYEQNSDSNKGDFLFVIDDAHDYTRLSDFKSKEARDLFRELQKMKKIYSEHVAMLEKKRDEYASADEGLKRKLRHELLMMERELEYEQKTIEDAEVNVRNTEINFLTK